MSPSPPARARPMRLLLPIVWGLGCVAGFSHPGDEYGLVALGSILGVWVAVLGIDRPQAVMIPALLIGCGAMFGLGLLLDRLRASPRWWGAIWAVAAIGFYGLLMAQYPSVEAAVAKNGSVAAYLICAAQLATYLATLVAFGVAGGRYVRATGGLARRGPA